MTTYYIEGWRRDMTHPAVRWNPIYHGPFFSLNNTIKRMQRCNFSVRLQQTIATCGGHVLWNTRIPFVRDRPHYCCIFAVETNRGDFFVSNYTYLTYIMLFVNVSDFYLLSIHIIHNIIKLDFCDFWDKQLRYWIVLSNC